MLLIQASNIHTGGGSTLLSPLLQVPLNQARRVWVDERYSLPDTLAEDVEIRRVTPSLPSRLRAERELINEADRGDVLLCLGNLPPLLKPLCRTVVYLQNRHLVDATYLPTLASPERVRLKIERFWLRLFASHAHLYLVQTPSMQQAVCQSLHLDEDKVRLAPYLPEDPGWPRSLPTAPTPVNDTRPFLYVASGESHKNHTTLVQAWVQLALEGLRLPLLLTLDPARFPALCKWIDEQVQKYQLDITMAPSQTSSGMKVLYDGARALIYPSLFESFGLPLVEARQAGLPILASELDYVREVLDPEQTFNPTSPHSIVRAIKRFAGISEQQLPSLNALKFMEMLLKDC